ncbi:hypothetical protein, partial [Escherichia coli]|uniref:hypothetical protein n=1 Tax=Escherichia coli TaxID=562 RepID=UPI00301BC456
FSDPGPVFHTIVSIKNDGHYFCRAGGNRPDGLNEPVTVSIMVLNNLLNWLPFGYGSYFLLSLISLPPL